MAKKDKLLERFLSKPRDFSWSELTKLLNSFGYKQISFGKTGGSRVRFIHENLSPIILHRPHPKPILRRYQIDEIINLLRQEMLI